MICDMGVNGQYIVLEVGDRMHHYNICIPFLCKRNCKLHIHSNFQHRWESTVYNGEDLSIGFFVHKIHIHLTPNHTNARNIFWAVSV